MHRLFFDEGPVLGDPRLGEPFLASGPLYVSLPAYVEIMTGVVSGCFGNECRPQVHWNVASEIARRDPARGAAVFPSWETIARTLPPDPSIYRETGRRDGDPDPAYPGHGDYRPDRRTAEKAIHYLLRNKPRLLWVSLGDTDEWAHRGDYRGYIDSLRYADSFVGELCAHLEGMQEYREKTVVLVTTDHGREESFSHHFSSTSAAVWLMARGGPIGRKGSVGLSSSRHLRDIAPTILSLYGIVGESCDSCGSVLGELIDVEPRTDDLFARF